MRKLTVVGSFVATLFAAGVALADSAAIVIANDPGGYLLTYVRGWENIAALRNQIEIRGNCLSACTLVLGLVPAERVCVREDAKFGFHSVSVNYGEHSPEGTRYLWSLYPPPVQDFVRSKGWDGGTGEPSNGLVMVAGTVFYPLCGSSPRTDRQFAVARLDQGL